jgi:hypothetical protein
MTCKESKLNGIACFSVNSFLNVSTSSRSSISGLSTKRFTSTLNDIIYYYYMSSRFPSAKLPLLIKHFWLLNKTIKVN